MSKVQLTTITSGYSSVAALNSNMTAIATAVENTLSRDGTSPNSMGAALDMDSNPIINVPTPASNNEAANKAYVDAVGNTIGGAAAFATQLASTSDSTLGDALVGVKRTATGAHATTLHTYIEGQLFNVKSDFGAVGDGGVDDTAAIRAAITAASSVTTIPAVTGDETDGRKQGNTVFFPKGKYKFTDTLFIPPHVVLQGAGGLGMFSLDFATATSSTVPGATLYYVPSDISHAAIALHGWVTATGAVIAADGSVDISSGDKILDATYRGSQGAGLVNLNIVSSNTAARLGVSLQAGMLARVENILVKDFKRGIRSRSAWMTTYDGIYIANADTYGMHVFDPASELHLKRGWIHHGASGASATSIELGYCVGSVSGFQMEASDKGIHLLESNNLHLTGLTWDNTATACIHLNQPGDNQLNVDNCLATLGVASTTVFINAAAANPTLKCLIDNLRWVNLSRVVGPNITGSGVSMELTRTALGASENLGAVANATSFEWRPSPREKRLNGTGELDTPVYLPGASSAERISYIINGSGVFYTRCDSNGFSIHDYGTGSLRVRMRAGGGITVGNTSFYAGTGSPETVQVGNVGDWFYRDDGGAGTYAYRKNSGTASNTGWVGIY